MTIVKKRELYNQFKKEMNMEKNCEFYFSMDDQTNNTSSTLSYAFPATPSWDEVLPMFKQFLEGCGYVMPSNTGHFDFVTED